MSFSGLTSLRLPLVAASRFGHTDAMRHLHPLLLAVVAVFRPTHGCANISIFLTAKEVYDQANDLVASEKLVQELRKATDEKNTDLVGVVLGKQSEFNINWKFALRPSFETEDTLLSMHGPTILEAVLQFFEIKSKAGWYTQCVVAYAFLGSLESSLSPTGVEDLKKKFADKFAIRNTYFVQYRLEQGECTTGLNESMRKCDADMVKDVVGELQKFLSIPANTPLTSTKKQKSSKKNTLYITIALSVTVVALVLAVSFCIVMVLRSKVKKRGALKQRSPRRKPKSADTMMDIPTMPTHEDADEEQQELEQEEEEHEKPRSKSGT